MKKLLIVLFVGIIPVSAHARCVIGDPTSTCGQDAVNQALQNGGASSQQMWDTINNANVATQHRVQQNQQYWLNYSNQQVQQNQQMLQNMWQQNRQRYQQQRQWDDYLRLQEQQRSRDIVWQDHLRGNDVDLRDFIGRQPCVTYSSSGDYELIGQADTTVYGKGCR